MLKSAEIMCDTMNVLELIRATLKSKYIAENQLMTANTTETNGNDENK